MSIVKKLGNKRVTKKILWLLLACFAGNVDAAQVRSVLDTYNSIKGVQKAQAISTILKYLSNQIACNKMVTNASQSDGQLKQLIENLINTINGGNSKDAKDAATILYKVIDSSINEQAMDNHYLHSASHFKDESVNTANALKYMLGNAKDSHTRLKNYEYDTIFSKVMSSDVLINQSTDITFLKNVGGNNNANQIKIIVPIHLVCEFPKIQELYGEKRDIKDSQAKKYKIQCMINITANGLVQKKAANVNADGRSGSLYPIK